MSFEKRQQKWVACALGLFFVIVMIGIAIVFPSPSPFQYVVFRVVLAIAVAGVAVMIPGLIDIDISTTVRASGAIAVFVIIYFFSPAAILVQSPSSTTIVAAVECAQKDQSATIDGKLIPLSDWSPKDCVYVKSAESYGKSMMLSTWGLIYEYNGSSFKKGWYIRPGNVFVVLEHSSVFAGYSSKESAISSYRGNFPDGPNIEEIPYKPEGKSQNKSNEDWGIFGRHVKTIKFEKDYNFDNVVKQIENYPEADTIVLSFYSTITAAKSINPEGFKVHIRLNDYIPAKTGATIGSFILPNGRVLKILHFRPAPEGELTLTVSK